MTTITLKSIYASLPKTTRGKPIVIGGDPKGKNFLYVNGNHVIIRNLQNPSECDVYSEHTKEATVAKYSPSGFYIASGDVTGKVRVWDTVNPEHILKAELSALGAPVKDLDWTLDSQKLVIGGEGRETFARALTFDSGNSVGDMTGHSKSINSVAVRQQRPMRAASGSEDFTIGFFEGPPFKWKSAKSEHTNFVNCVRYAPDGSCFISGGADGKLHMYEGKAAEFLGEFGEKAHNGGIYAICFSGDSKKLLSVSGDKTAKIWDVESKTVETEFVMGKNVTDMQVGCLWQGETIITVSLSGFINYLDPSNPQQPHRIIKGHNNPISALAVSSDGSSFLTGDSNGLIVSWSSATGDNDDIKGKGHTNMVTDMVLDGDNLITVGMDDTVRFTPINTMQYGDDMKLESQPKGVDSVNGTTVVASINHLIVLQNGKKVSSTPIKFEPLCVAINPSMMEVAVGAQSKHIVFYSLEQGVLAETRTHALPGGGASTLKYSPDGQYLACGTTEKKILLFRTENNEEIMGSWGSQHYSRVTSVAWSPNSQRFASGSVDSRIIIWDPTNTSGSRPSVMAHPPNGVNRVAWLDDDTVLSVGQESTAKIWSILDKSQVKCQVKCK